MSTSTRSSSTGSAAWPSWTASELFLQSRSGKPLGRYFPELALPPGRYVLDGEIVVRGSDGREDFDALGQRVHPAASRVERLAVETPGRVRGLRPARAGG